MSELSTYLIPAVNMPRLEEEIKKINRRAEKLGCKPVVLNVHRTVTEKKRDHLTRCEYEYTYHECTVEGEAPQLSGWTLVAVVEPAPNAEMLVREVPGQVCPPKYRTTDLRCDQCEMVRRRNAIYILRHVERGVHKQVGRNCLQDFLGGVSPESLLAKGEYMMDFVKLIKDAGDEEWGSRGLRHLGPIVPVGKFVAVCSVLIRKFGWITRSALKAMDDDYDMDSSKEATADLAWRLCTDPHGHSIPKFVREKGVHAERKDEILAYDSLEWAKGIDPESAPNTFMHDLGVACRQEYVTWRTHGFVACAITAFQREQAKKIAANQPRRVSRHVGEIKKRRVFAEMKVVLLKPYMSDIYQKTLVKFVDAEGNAFIWRASGQPDWLELDKTFNVKATVIQHDTFNGEAQTIINRVEPCQLTTATA